MINASACGVVESARQHPGDIGKVYAGRNGIIGAPTEDLIDTSVESQAAIGALAAIWATSAIVSWPTISSGQRGTSYVRLQNFAVPKKLTTPFAACWDDFAGRKRDGVSWLTDQRFALWGEELPDAAS